MEMEIEMEMVIDQDTDQINSYYRKLLIMSKYYMKI